MQGHNPPPGFHARHTRLHTPSTTPGVLVPFRVQRVVHPSLSLLQPRLSQHRIIPKECFSNAAVLNFRGTLNLTPVALQGQLSEHEIFNCPWASDMIIK